MWETQEGVDTTVVEELDGELRKQALHHVWRGRLVKLGQSPDGERERERENWRRERRGERVESHSPIRQLQHLHSAPAEAAVAEANISVSKSDDVSVGPRLLVPAGRRTRLLLLTPYYFSHFPAPR